MALLLIVALGILDFLSTVRLTECFRSLEQSKNRVILLEEAGSMLKDIQRAHRGFVVTRDKRFLDPYYHSLEIVPSVKARLLTGAWENSQENEMKELARLIDVAVDFADDALVRKLSFEEDPVRRRILKGKQLVDSAHIHIAKLKTMELARQRLIEDDVQKWLGFNRAVIVSIISIFTVLLVLGLLQLRRTLKDRSRLYNDIQRKHQELSQSHEELATLNEELHSSNDHLSESVRKLESIQHMLSLREKELHHAQVISRTGSFRLNTSTMEFQFSPMLAQILGFDGVEKLPSFDEFVERIHPDDRSRIRDRMNMIVNKDEIVFNEFRLVVDGETRFIRSARQLVANEGGPVFLGAVSDITELKRAYQELNDTNLKLQESNNELEAFTYSISHDLKAPLRSLLMYAHLLLDKVASNKTPDERKWLEVILKKGKHMNDLVDGLLTLSSYGSSALQKKEVDMAQLVREISDELLASYPRSKIDFETPLGKAVADPALIQQVWINLISNALKFSANEDEPLVTLSRKEEENAIRFIVHDNGVGFEQEKSQDLFVVFRRFHSPEQFSGSGVGLAIVKRIINSHGGEVNAEGQHGHGATFWFTLPK